MPNITVRDIPDDIYLKIKQSAIANKRSINSEIIVGLESSYGNLKPDKATILENIRRVRRKTVGKIYLREEELTIAKNEGRD